MKTMVPSLLVVLAVIGGCFVAGCSDDDDEPLVPSAFRGTWIVVAEDGSTPVTGGLIDVDSRGRISGTDVLVTVAQANGGDVTGDVDENGNLSFTFDDNGTVYTVIGDLGTDDTGSGTWTARQNGTVVGSGTWVACRANNTSLAGTWDGTIDGDAQGSGVVGIDSAGVITGSFDIGTGPEPMVGVVNGQGDILGLWENSVIVVFEGSTTSSTAASGTWRTNDSLTGTWDLTKR